MMYQIKVCRECIDEAIRTGNNPNCPVGVSLRKVFRRPVSVGRHTALIGSKMYKLPDIVAEKTEIYDRTGKMEPFIFTLEV